MDTWDKILIWLFYFAVGYAVITYLVLVVSKLCVFFATHCNRKIGVDESIYIDIGGQKQHIRIRGKNRLNPIIIFLHGGPGLPNSCTAHVYEKYLTDSFTIINWTERGSGRTYYNNKKQDIDNETLSLDRLVDDLDELVDYAIERFNQEKVIIMAHSFGTMVGSKYIALHSEKVTAYIGVGQVINFSYEHIAYEHAKKVANYMGRDTTDIDEAFDYYKNGKGSYMDKLAYLRTVIDKYNVAPYEMSRMKGNWISFASPYMSINDIRWYFSPYFNIKRYKFLQRNLYKSFKTFDMNNNYSFEVPIIFISGEYDFKTPKEAIKEYIKSIEAPYVSYREMDGLSHAPFYDKPKDFADIFKEEIIKLDIK